MKLARNLVSSSRVANFPAWILLRAWHAVVPFRKCLEQATKWPALYTPSHVKPDSLLEKSPLAFRHRDFDVSLGGTPSFLQDKDPTILGHVPSIATKVRVGE